MSPDDDGDDNKSGTWELLRYVHSCFN
jgi:hypothetical protein